MLFIIIPSTLIVFYSFNFIISYIRFIILTFIMIYYNFSIFLLSHIIIYLFPFYIIFTSISFILIINLLSSYYYLLLSNDSIFNVDIDDINPNNSSDDNDVLDVLLFIADVILFTYDDLFSNLITMLS